MHDAELQRLIRAARDHRTRAALAREEAAVRGSAWWGHTLLQQSADYYERRARDVDRQMHGLITSDPAAASPGEP